MAMNPEMLKAMQALQQRQAQMQGAQGAPTDQAKQALQQKLQGIQDARGMLGQFSRGAPIYNATAPQAQMGGGPQFGPPVGNANAAANPMQMQQQMMQQRDAMAQQQAAQRQQQQQTDPFDQLRKSAETAKSVLAAHQMTDAANQMKQRRSMDMNNAMQNALQRRMQQAKKIQDATIKV